MQNGCYLQTQIVFVLFFKPKLLEESPPGEVRGVTPSYNRTIWL